MATGAEGSGPAANQRPCIDQTVSMRMDHRLQGRIDPSDVVQDTFLDADRRLAEFQADSRQLPLFLWLRLLATQRLVDLHRRHLGAQMRDASLEISVHQPCSLQTSSIWLASKLVDPHETGSSAAIRNEIEESVRAALDGMDATDREVLAMRHFEQLTNREVALALGLTTTAASNRYIRALRRLKKVLHADQF
jgi:RNA polymerase sigma-70 factor, ECF subfamily